MARARHLAQAVAAVRPVAPVGQQVVAVVARAKSALARVKAVPARARAAAVRTEQTGILDAARSRAREIILAAEREARRLDLEAAHRRDLIDEDHRIASDARRTESLLEDRERQAASIAAADAVRRQAEDEARETVDRAAAEAEVARMCERLLANTVIESWRVELA